MRGVGCFRQGAASATGYQGFPSPCGVWVVSHGCIDTATGISFRPLAGCGLFLLPLLSPLITLSFRPLAGCGLFQSYCRRHCHPQVSVPLRGVGCFAGLLIMMMEKGGGSVPLRGVGCFDSIAEMSNATCGFRPLAGCGLFPITTGASAALTGFRPLAGCGLFQLLVQIICENQSFRPLAGCGLFP